MVELRGTCFKGFRRVLETSLLSHYDLTFYESTHLGILHFCDFVTIGAPPNLGFLSHSIEIAVVPSFLTLIMQFCFCLSCMWNSMST